MAASTSTLRYPGFKDNDLTGLVAALVPTPRCHFIITSFTPLGHQSSTRKTTITDTLTRLLLPSNLLVSEVDTNDGCFLSVLAMIQGEVDPSELHQALGRIRDRRLVRDFIPWGPASIQVALSRGPPEQSSQKMTGLMMANHSNIRGVRNYFVTQANYL
jgi:tubulin gamma